MSSNDIDPADLDDGIRDTVILLWKAGFRTFTSCEGGKGLDTLLPFLDKFEAAGFSAGNWSNEPGYFPWFNFDEVVVDFFQSLYDNE